jgi:hypothetical protein
VVSISSTKVRNFSTDYSYLLPTLAEPGEIFVNVSTWLYPNTKPYYMISNYGRLFNKYIKRFITPTKVRNRYDIIRLESTAEKTYTREKRVYVRLDKLVLVHFRPIPYMFDMDVIHLDGDQFNNKVDNLMFDIDRWMRLNNRKQEIEDLKAHIAKFGVRYHIEPIKFEDASNCHFVHYHSAPKDKPIRPLAHIPNTPYPDLSKFHSTDYEPIDYSKRYKVNQNLYQLSYTDVCNICKWFSEHPLSHEISQLERIPYFLEMLQHFNYFCRPINGMLELCNNIFDRKIYTNISDKYIF